MCRAPKWAGQASRRLLRKNEAKGKNGKIFSKNLLLFEVIIISLSKKCEESIKKR